MMVLPGTAYFHTITPLPAPLAACSQAPDIWFHGNGQCELTLLREMREDARSQKYQKRLSTEKLPPQ